MKVVILAGGLGTRLSEETVIKPKPMVYPFAFRLFTTGKIRTAPVARQGVKKTHSVQPI